MSNAKERHYWSQLRASLTAGQWLAQYPAKDPRGGQLSWTELFRKFNKHCKGFHDVSEIASQTYGLALLLSTHALNEDDDYRSPRDLSIELGKECILPPERGEEATEGYEKLKSLQSANSDVRPRAMELRRWLIFSRVFILPSHTTRTHSEDHRIVSPISPKYQTSPRSSSSSRIRRGRTRAIS